MNAYIDMDGVITDVVNHLITHEYLTEVPQSYSIDVPWTELGEEFWATMPVDPDIINWLALRYAIGYHDTLITRVQSMDEMRGKHRLLKKLTLTKYMPVMMHTCPRADLMNPHVVLLDDCWDNVIRWTAAGGTAELYQQPWSM